MRRIEMAILLRLASSNERMIPSTIGYCLIGSGDIVPRYALLSLQAEPVGGTQS